MSKLAFIGTLIGAVSLPSVAAALNETDNVTISQVHRVVADSLLNGQIIQHCQHNHPEKAYQAMLGKEALLTEKTLETLADSLRDHQQFKQASQVYALLGERNGSITAKAQASMSLADAGDVANALSMLDQAQPSTLSDSRDLTRAHAYILMQQADSTRTLDYIQQGLRRLNNDGVLLQLKHEVLAKMGLETMTASDDQNLQSVRQVQIANGTYQPVHQSSGICLCQLCRPGRFS
ncbi:hypothetical protein [Aquitalea sp. ASV11]|uniref:hypothetical protein n=1 Tax=Aquitalea sp. ASV11 TaxID=2795103 RepID=UPI0018ECF139|nr:hypothetical protein [Aquitalea sp. ASV11]